MVRPSLLSWSLAFLAALGAGTASADPITLTGVVERDFDQANPSVRISPVSTDPAHIGQASWMSQRGWVSGFSIKDVRSSYDEDSDTLFVGVNTFGIAGDADGNGDPGGADPLTTSSGGIDPPFMGADKSIAVAFAPNGPWQREELAAVYASSGRITTYLGDWHSHPAGTALPSPKDLRTAKRVARSRAARASRPLTIILMCDDEKGWLAAAYRYSRWRLRPVKLEPFKEESTPI